MINEQPDPLLVPPGIFAERERFAHEMWAALPERVVKALHKGRFTGMFPNGPMPLGGQHEDIRLPEIALANRTFSFGRWQR